MEKEMLQQILDELKGLKEGQKRIEHKLDATHEQVVKNTENIEIIKTDVKDMRKDLCNVEQITASNWSDISKLKSIK